MTHSGRAQNTREALAPLEPPYAPATQKLLGSYPKREGQLLGLFRVFAHSDRFLGRVPNLLDEESPLSLCERELVILRTTARNRAEYEWGVHVTAFAKAAALDDEQVMDTVNRAPSSGCWSEQALSLLAITDELLERGRLSAARQAEFDGRWSTAQRLEILMLIGTYSMISYVANVADLPLEEWGARFPNNR